jgi:hypothetical protein
MMSLIKPTTEASDKLKRIYEYIETQRFEAPRYSNEWIALVLAEAIIDDAQQIVSDEENN